MNDGNEGTIALITSSAAERSHGHGDHLVHFYEDESLLARRIATFLGEGLSGGDLVTVITTKLHEQAFQQELSCAGFDVAQARASGQLTFFDADETLRSFMRDGEPDPELFELEVGAVIAKQSGAPRLAGLRAYGEMADILWRQGHKVAAIQVEELWNDLQRRHSFTWRCAYAMGGFYKEPCAAHGPVLIDEPVARAAPGAESNAETRSLPPEYARRLAREMAQREEVERALREALRELRAKDDALRGSEEQLRDFLENATVGLHRVGPDGTILWANSAELDMLGYSQDEYVGQPIDKFHVDAPVIQDILGRLRCGEALYDYEARLRAKDGSVKHVLISSSVYSRDGKFIHTRCFTRDISERRQAEEALRRSERQLQLVTDALPVLVSYLDSTRRYRFVSAVYERWFGRPRAEILGKQMEELLGADAYAAIRQHVERALAGENVRYEAELSYPDGSARCIEAVYVPQKAADGSIAGFVALVNDVTERKSLERFRAAAATRAERIWKITAAIADAVSSAEVFEALVDRVRDATEATSAALWLVDEEHAAARLVRGLGYSDAARRAFEMVPLDVSPSTPFIDSLRSGEALWIGSQAELVRRYPHLKDVVTEGRAYRVTCLPLIAHGRVLGVLALTIERAWEPDKEERDFLLLIARYASQAIERLRLLDSERRSRDAADAAALRLGLLNQASRVFVETDLELEPRLRGIVRELGCALSSCVGVALVGTDGLLHTAAVYHPVPEAEELLRSLGQSAPLREGEGVTGSVVASGKGALISSLEPDDVTARAAPAYREFLASYPSYALMAAPLRARSHVIGAVTASRTRVGESYTADDLQLLEQLAARAGGAIENSRLYEEMVRARTRAEQLYRFAQAIVAADRIETVFEAALTSIQAALGAERAAILTFDANDVMRFVAWHKLSDAYRRAVEGHSPWSPDAKTAEPVLVPDVSADASLRAFVPLLQREGIAALAFVPLVTPGRLLGKFMVYYERPHVFAAHEVETATAIANHLASVITRFAAVTRLEDTLRANELFAGVLAHDLLNPVGAIVNAAQVLLMRRATADAPAEFDAKALNRILSSGQRMARMIEQLLDFTRARSGGGIQILPRETDLETLCTQAAGELELAHPEWNIQCRAAGDLVGSWDPDRLSQVVSNLIANAGQHGTAGGPISLELDGTHAEHVDVRVHNEGAIDAALLPHLFDPFRTTQQPRGRRRGLGLGLFIVHELVCAHGGTVDVASSSTIGTIFSVRLPRRRDAREERPAATDS